MKLFVSDMSMFFLGFHGKIHISGKTEAILFILLHFTESSLFDLPSILATVEF